MSVVDVIRHYQRSIEKCQDDEERMLHCINKLGRLPITVQLLKETGVGRTVNALRKYEGQVGEAAKYTVTKWKQMVAEEESSEEDVEQDGAEVHTEEVDEAYARDDEEEEEEEEEPDSGGDTSTGRETSKHNHRESHSKSRRDDNHRQEYKLQKERSYKDAETSVRKHKDDYKSLDFKNAEEKHTHKRKRESSKNHRRDEKRKKYESDSENLSDNNSESEEMQIDEQINEENNTGACTDEEEVEQEEDEEEDEDGGHYNSGRNECESRLSAPSHGSHAKQHGSSSGSSHHSKHHKESHRKHDKHKEKKSHSDKHSRKTDSDKVSERTSGSDHKEKHSKHKDNKHEHKSNKHKNSNISVSSAAEGKKEKGENVKPKKDSVLIDSNSSKADSKKRKEKTDNAEKTNSSHKHKSPETKTKEVKDKKSKKHELDEDDDDGGISSMSGASFAEALGMVDPLKKKKPANNVSSSHSKSARSSSSKTSTATEKNSSKNKEMKPPKIIPPAKDEPAPLLSSSVKLEPLKVDLDATLPEISPNYRPLPHPNVDALPHRKIKMMSDEEALALAMSQKNQRTRVYSGMKSGKSWSSVPTLFDICVRVLQENIDAIEYTGGVPYDLLKPVLNIATPDQLFMLEHYNPYLIEETDELWEFHCKKSFRNKIREELETWRDMYLRCVEEREAKLKALTSNIQQSIAKSTPVRQTKLAYVDSVAKPPRNVAKQQAKYGTAGPVAASKGSPVKASKPGFAGLNSSPSTSSAALPVPSPRIVQSVAKVKPRMAPLMQKTMKLVKSFKR